MRRQARGVVYDERPVIDASKIEICEAACAASQAGIYNLFVGNLRAGTVLVVVRDP